MVLTLLRKDVLAARISPSSSHLQRAWRGGPGQGMRMGRAQILGCLRSPLVYRVISQAPCWNLCLQLVIGLAWLLQEAFMSPGGCPSPGLPLPKPPPCYCLNPGCPYQSFTCSHARPASGQPEAFQSAPGPHRLSGR